MSTNAFTSLANIRLPSPCRLLPNSCCPDKDLVLLFSRLGGIDRMSLWNSNQGWRVWESGAGDDNASSHVVNIAWSPDGQSIAIIRDPPAISLHSLQDGHCFLSLPIPLPLAPERRIFRPTGIWWFRDERKSHHSCMIPDIFQRNDNITGSAHSILKLLPLLDNFQEESEKVTATDLFAFQGSHTRPNLRTQLPSVIENWPTLSVDLLTASIKTSSHSKPNSETNNLAEMDSSNINSILLVSDDFGNISSYLDGTFPLGCVSFGLDVGVISVVKHPLRPYFCAQTQFKNDYVSQTSLYSAAVDIPLLAQRKCRDLAKLSSTARELSWYMLRVVKEMRGIWYGSESNTGARELGPKWIQSLETKQKEQFGQAEPSPILDLTSLLTTGRTSESLLDFLGSGEQMSERGIQKWESTVTEALIKLRDFPKSKWRRHAKDFTWLWRKYKDGPDCRPQFAPFELPFDDLTTCLELASRGIIISSWLAAVSRRELSRFREFISWLRYEVNIVTSPNDAHISRHDILEVNGYFISGLVSSSIDKWFVGSVPQFQPIDLGISAQGNGPLKRVLHVARKVANDPPQMAWQTNIPQKDHDHLDRNLDALVQELADRCQRVFNHAAAAPSRSAVVSFDSKVYTAQVPEKERPLESSPVFPFRERTIASESGEFLQHLAVRMPLKNNNQLLLAQLRFSVEASELPSAIVDIALLECYLPEEGPEETHLDLDLLDVDFFDDECVVILYRLRKKERQSFIATVNYNDVGYRQLRYEGYVKRPAREDLMQDALDLWKSGQLPVVKGLINRRRALSGCKRGDISLALNGRKGRRVACVLDSTGTTMESIDLEGDAEDMEVADDARAG